MNAMDPNDRPMEIPLHDLDIQAVDPHGPAVRSGWGFWKTCLAISLGLVTIAFIGCLGSAYYIYKNGARLATRFVRAGIEQSLNDTALPAQEKAAILTQVDRLVDAVNQGRLTVNDMQTIVTDVGESPLFAAWMLHVVDAKYLRPSGLSEDEKAAGMRVLERVVRGLYDKTMKMSDLESLEGMVFRPGTGNRKQIKEKLTDPELRELLAACREKVDAAQVPDEPFKVNITEEVKRFVDKVLNEGSPPATEPATDGSANDGNADNGEEAEDVSPSEPAESPAAEVESPAEVGT